MQRPTLTWNAGRSISESRGEFEATPDRGFFGKGFVRPFNVVWNYLVKGFVGTTCAFVGHAALFSLNTVFSVLAVVATPVWALASAVAVYVFSLLLYDVDAPRGSPGLLLPRLVIWDFLLNGKC